MPRSAQQPICHRPASARRIKGHSDPERRELRHEQSGGANHCINIPNQAAPNRSKAHPARPTQCPPHHTLRIRGHSLPRFTSGNIPPWPNSAKHPPTAPPRRPPKAGQPPHHGPPSAWPIRRSNHAAARPHTGARLTSQATRICSAQTPHSRTHRPDHPPSRHTRNAHRFNRLELTQSNTSPASLNPPQHPPPSPRVIKRIPSGPGCPNTAGHHPSMDPPGKPSWPPSRRTVDPPLATSSQTLPPRVSTTYGTARLSGSGHQYHVQTGLETSNSRPPPGPGNGSEATRPLSPRSAHPRLHNLPLASPGKPAAPVPAALTSDGPPGTRMTIHRGMKRRPSCQLHNCAGLTGPITGPANSRMEHPPALR